MAQITITNLTTLDVPITELYDKVPAGVGKTLVVQRFQAVFTRMPNLMAAINASKVSIAIVYTADELASGLLIPSAVGPGAVAPVAPAVVDAAPIVMRAPLPIGVPAVPDDIALFAAGALPYKFRVLDAHVKVSAAVALSTLVLRDEALGAGNVLASMSGAATGRSDMTDNLTALATPGPLKGLFVNRSDGGVVGEVIVLIRKET